MTRLISNGNRTNRSAIDIFVIKRHGGYRAYANWKSRTNITHYSITIVSHGNHIVLKKALYKLVLLYIIWIKAV